MIKIIVHLSDIHIKNIKEHARYRKQFNIFLEDVKNKLDKYEYNEIRFVITGDLFDQKINISNEQVIFTSRFFNEIIKIGKLIIIPGNHDFLINNTDRLDSITPVVELLNTNNIIYYKDSGVYKDENINWVVFSLYQKNQRPVFTKNDDEFYVGLFHGQITGLLTDLGFKFEDAYDSINFLGLDIVLCGDIHRRQKFNMPYGGQAIMIGSFIQTGFGETIKHHGYGIYNVETKQYSFHDLPNEHPYMHFKINDISDIENGKEELLNLG